MIPTIGIMIGFYIITRMASFLTRKGDRSESFGPKLLSVITIIVTIIAIIDLFFGSKSVPKP